MAQETGDFVVGRVFTRGIGGEVLKGKYSKGVDGGNAAEAKPVAHRIEIHNRKQSQKQCQAGNEPGEPPLTAFA